MKMDDPAKRCDDKQWWSECNLYEVLSLGIFIENGGKDFKTWGMTPQSGALERMVNDYNEVIKFKVIKFKQRGEQL